MKKGRLDDKSYAVLEEWGWGTAALGDGAEEGEDGGGAGGTGVAEERVEVALQLGRAGAHDGGAEVAERAARGQQGREGGAAELLVERAELRVAPERRHRERLAAHRAPHVQQVHRERRAHSPCC